MLLFSILTAMFRNQLMSGGRKKKQKFPQNILTNPATHDILKILTPKTGHIFIARKEHTMDYICKLYSSDGTQTASVCMTGIDNAENVNSALLKKLDSIDSFIQSDYYPDSSWGTAQRPKNLLKTEFSEYSTYCTAEEVVFFALDEQAQQSPQSAITEMSFNGVTYRNITELTAYSDDNIDSTYYSFIAEKAGALRRVYAFPSYVFPFSGGYTFSKFSGHGIVDLPLDTPDTKHIYIGSYQLCSDDIDYIRVYDAANVLLEATQDKFLFKVLIDNKLHNKISITAGSSVVYSFTPFENTLHQDDVYIDPERYTSDLVFSNIGGEYICNSNSGFGAMTIASPQLPSFEDIDPQTARALFEQCMGLCCESFSTAQTYTNGSFTFVRQENTDTFCAQHEDICILARMTKGYAPPVVYFQESYTSPYSLCIESVEFHQKSAAVKLHQFNDLAVSYTDSAPESIELTFSELKKHNIFKDKKSIPENLYFEDTSAHCILSKLSLLTTIAEAVISFGGTRLAAVGSPRFLEDPQEMRLAIYDAGMTPDSDVVAKAVELKKNFNRTGRIPNVAIIGEAGCGKSTLIKRLGKVFNKEVLCLSPSDLKGAFIGHTKGEVIEKLIIALKENKIFFVDEVYELMTDSFGREAISLLLPLMTGDRTRVDDRDISVDFETGIIDRKGEITEVEGANGVPPIWIAGYEDDVRIMLSRNQGLFRRFERLTLKAPRTGELYSDLLRKLDSKLARPENEAVYNCLKKLFEDNEKLITNYFRWGNQPQNSKYFANYAGVEKLLDSCIDRIPFDKSEGEMLRELEGIIASSKRDIKRQLDTLLRMNSDRADKTERIEMISDIDTRFTDLVGCDAQIEYMRSIIDMLVNKGRYSSYNITIPKGALLKGLPGVGKTFISRAFAGELQEAFEKAAPDKRVGFIAVSAPELVSKGTEFITSIFNAVDEYDFCVIFIDEVDAIARHRNYNRYFRHYLELIKQMDGIEQRSNFFILAATNAPESLDPAFVRSGRIDKEFEFLLPDKEARAALAERAVTKRSRILSNFVCDEYMEEIASLAKDISGRTTRYTAGDIDSVINLAFVMYDSEPRAEKNSGRSRYGHRELDRLYGFILEAIERKNIGEPNPKAKEAAFSLEANNSSCSSTAVHEVGHALVSLLCGEKPFDKITILPRGNALGYVSHSGSMELNKKALKNRIRTAMGGRIAEALIYGDENISSGASQDMQTATNLARYMVESIGFTEDFSFMTLVRSTSNYLGEKEYTCSDAFRQRCDEAVCALLRDLYRETTDMLSEKKELIIALAERVFNAEEMSGEEFSKIYNELI